MTRAIIVRLDDADHVSLFRQAAQLRVQPGTLARMLLHAGLNEGGSGRDDARAAVARLVQRSEKRPPGDAVALVTDARSSLDTPR